MKKYVLRGLVPAVLAKQGYAVAQQTSRGVLPGSRLIATRDGVVLRVAVKVVLERRIGFSKQGLQKWRTLSFTDIVVAIAPTGDTGSFELFAFRSDDLVRCFDNAWSELNAGARSLSVGAPIFVPLDADSPKKLGHGVSNLKLLATWVERIAPDEIKGRLSENASESFIDRVKREFAERNEIDVSRVSVEFRIIS